MSKKKRKARFSVLDAIAGVSRVAGDPTDVGTPHLPAPADDSNAGVSAEVLESLTSLRDLAQELQPTLPSSPHTPAAAPQEQPSANDPATVPSVPLDPVTPTEAVAPTPAPVEDIRSSDPVDDETVDADAPTKSLTVPPVRRQSDAHHDDHLERRFIEPRRQHGRPDPVVDNEIPPGTGAPVVEDEESMAPPIAAEEPLTPAASPLASHDSNPVDEPPSPSAPALANEESVAPTVSTEEHIAPVDAHVAPPPRTPAFEPPGSPTPAREDEEPVIEPQEVVVHEPQSVEDRALGAPQEYVSDHTARAHTVPEEPHAVSHVTHLPDPASLAMALRATPAPDEPHWSGTGDDEDEKPQVAEPMSTSRPWTFEAASGEIAEIRNNDMTTAAPVPLPPPEQARHSVLQWVLLAVIVIGGCGGAVAAWWLSTPHHPIDYAPTGLAFSDLYVTASSTATLSVNTLSRGTRELDVTAQYLRATPGQDVTVSVAKSDGLSSVTLKRQDYILSPNPSGTNNMEIVIPLSSPLSTGTYTVSVMHGSTVLRTWPFEVVVSSTHPSTQPSTQPSPTPS